MNRLAESTSPYLLQHAENPVDWYPWGDEAFDVARREDKPILLSVGYSSCHWCHVMAHESFEDPDTAAIMNELFVNVKVDREERPDVDAIYMNAVQAMTGRGGWPMTVFLTPEGKPFYAGTYYPKTDHHGMPSFTKVMAAVSEAWRERRDQATEQADRITEAITRTIPAGEAVDHTAAIEAGYHHFETAFDDDYGGFGTAPKFPQEPALEFLLRIAERPFAPQAADMLIASLRAMAVGGLHDHVGGGFARYAVDRSWLIPHFEKMLYNNAQLAHLYLRAAQLPGDHRGRFLGVARSTLEYVLRDMTDPAGGWYAAEDADSEGVEGKFYVFTKEEFDAAAGADAEVAAAYFGVTEQGNFEGANHLHEATPPALVAMEMGLDQAEVLAAIERVRSRLAELRAGRVRPGLDDKVITAWNGLMLRTMAEAAAVLGDERYLRAAVANAEFITSTLVVDGRAMRSWRSTVSGPGFLDDHAAYALGLYQLHAVTGDDRWFTHAERLVDAIGDRFWDPADGLFQVADDVADLITRPKDMFDNPAPSGASLAVEALLTSHALTGRSDRLELANAVIGESALLIESHPSAVAYLLGVLATSFPAMREVAVVGPAAENLHAALWDAYRPEIAVTYAPAGSDGSSVPLAQGRESGKAYVCEGFVCRLPADDPAELRRLLDEPG